MARRAARPREIDTREAAVRRARDQLVNTIWREQYESGDRIKLLWCRDLCQQAHWPVPAWVRGALAREHEAWQRALVEPRRPRSQQLTFERFLQGERRGRRSKDDRLRHLVIIEARELAIDWEITGERTWEFVAAAVYEYRQKHQCWDRTFGKTWHATAASVKRIWHDLATTWPKYQNQSPYSLRKVNEEATEAPSNPYEEYLKHEAEMTLRGRKKAPHDIAIRYELMELMHPRLKDEFSPDSELPNQASSS